MKIFLTYTAIIEGLTGIALLGFPSGIIRLLLGADLEGNSGLLTAMIGGAAILSIAFNSWLLRDHVSPREAVKVLFVYNFLLTGIVLYGVFAYGFKGAVIWLVFIFHFLQTVMSIRMLQKKSANKNQAPINK